MPVRCIYHESRHAMCCGDIAVVCVFSSTLAFEDHHEHRDNEQHHVEQTRIEFPVRCGMGQSGFSSSFQSRRTVFPCG